MEHWYVVQTKPHAEETAVRHLERQGMRPYLPRFRREVRHARKVSSVLRPLFPGYLFLRLDLSAARWQSVNSTIGVQRLLGQDGSPLPVLDPIVESIRAREDIDGMVKIEPPPAPKPGESVMVNDGPFRDIVGLCAGLDDGHRVAVLLQVLGRQVRVSLPLEWIAT